MRINGPRWQISIQSKRWRWCRKIAPMQTEQFGRQTRRGLLVGAALSVAGSLVLARFADAASTVQNLQLTAGPISWIDHDDIQILCEFQWIGPNKSWVLNPRSPSMPCFAIRRANTFRATRVS